MNSSEHPEAGVFRVSIDEIAHTLLIKSFKLVAQPLGKCILCKLSQTYGENAWRQIAGGGLSFGEHKRLLGTQRHHLKDMHLICELILFNVEVLSVDMVDIDGVREKAVWLERLVADVDLVSRTRTFLFHGMCVSVSEVVRCMVRLERLCHRLPQLVLNRKKQDEFQQYLQVRRCEVRRSFFFQVLFAHRIFQRKYLSLFYEKVNAHLPYYSTLRKFWNMGSFKRFKLVCSSSVMVTQKPTSKPDLYWVVWLMSHTKS